MLKKIDPLLNADVLYALRAMGHGDDLVICDTNFPADSVARQTVLGKVLRIDNTTAAEAARAILEAAGETVFAIGRIEAGDNPDEASIRIDLPPGWPA